MKKYVCFIVLFTIIVSTTTADALADILQDLAVQTACLGMYSTAQTGVYVTSRYDDPPDWYDPPMLANRFAAMSGNMTRINTFYGVCFDYAQFAWDDIKRYQKSYNDAGMIGQQWYIAVTNKNDPYTIILYDPVSRENATIISNGVYLKENSRHRVYAHDGATGHAWLWVQHSNGTWYWIDPTWTDNTGYVWWGIVKNGEEIQYDPDPKYCVASNYPKSNRTNPTPSGTPPKPTVTQPSTAVPKPVRNNNQISFIGYNYTLDFPIGFTFGFSGFYTSLNLNLILFTTDDGVTIGSRPVDGFTGETKENGLEITFGYLFNLIDSFLYLPVGVGLCFTDVYEYYHDRAGNTGWYNDRGELENRKLIFEAGLQLLLANYFYLLSTYRLVGFTKTGFTIGAGFIF